MPILVPDSVNRRLMESQLEYAAEVLNSYELHRELKHWNQELKQIDPYLELIKVPEHVDLPGVKPGYFHVVRHNPGAPPSIVPHEGPDGEFREPDSGLFENLRKGDMWSERSQREREKKQKQLQAAEDRKKEREREDRQNEIMDRYRHAFIPGVRIPRGV